MPSSIVQAREQGECPVFLDIGHVTRDLLPGGETFTPGGTVTFAALTAYHLGLTSALVTCADETLLSQLPALLPQSGLAARLSPVSTTFENSYTAGFRVQYLRARATALAFADIPPA